MRDKVFKYVPHYPIEDYIILGWVMRKSFMETHYDYYCVLMEWLCECPVRLPTRKEPAS